MRVFLAGATGAIGRPLVPMLLEAGHEVTGMTRSERGAAAVREAGAEAVIADALDPRSVKDAMAAARPEVVVHQLTAIPYKLTPRGYAKAFVPTNRLRTEGTRNLIDAALAAGARRMVAQSISFAYRPGAPGLRTEGDPLWHDAPPALASVMRALEELEGAVLGTDGIGGAVLRYGYFYGPHTSYASDGYFSNELRRRRLPVVGPGAGVFSFIHVHDAAAATVLAIERGATGVYNVVDDEPAPMAEWVPAFAEALGAGAPRHVPVWLARVAAGGLMTRMATEQSGASNARAKSELGLELRYPSWRQGFPESVAAA